MSVFQLKETELVQVRAQVNLNSCHGTAYSVYFQRFCGNKINRKYVFFLTCPLVEYPATHQKVLR